MPALKVEKVVGSLPGTLAPDTIYFVRTGAGFEIRVTDSTGVVAHSLNASGGGAGLTYRQLLSAVSASQ